MTVIRPMRPSDAAAVATLATQLGYPSTDAESRRRFADLADRPEHAVLVAVDGDDLPQGWVHVVRARSLVADAQADIGGLVVAEGARSAGIGADLLAAAEAWAVANGATEMVVRSRTSRTRAHRFYEREGYRLVKESLVLGKPLSPSILPADSPSEGPE